MSATARAQVSDERRFAGRFTRTVEWRLVFKRRVADSKSK